MHVPQDVSFNVDLRSNCPEMFVACNDIFDKMPVFVQTPIHVAISGF